MTHCQSQISSSLSISRFNIHLQPSPYVQFSAEVSAARPKPYSFTTFDIAQTKSSSERCVRQKNHFDTSVETSNMTEYNGQCSSSSAFQETNDYYPSSSESSSESEDESGSEYEIEELLLRDQLLRKRRRRKKKKGLSAEQEERLERQRIIDENAVDLIKVILRENPHFSNYSDKALIARTGWSKTKIGNFIRAIRKGIRICQHTKAATQTSKSQSQKQIAKLYILTGLLETFVIQFFKERRMIDRETSGNAVLNKHVKKNSSKWKGSNEMDDDVDVDETPISPHNDADNKEEKAELRVDAGLEYEGIIDGDDINFDEEIILEEGIVDEEGIYDVDELFDEELIAEYQEIKTDVEEGEDDELPAVQRGPDAHPSWHNFVHIGEDRGDRNSRIEPVAAAPL
ncbi:hypothetical protein L5515_018971 [Caenorhabditis briggsae]|uniref:Uncharacterized protein n=1 Tax=Caenorhabditis briggsae TaxID=6238 RepID=A0AAE9FNE0_CAEBR|nr:hypothetical protein L5515_018971 [Caenorhabditis briggsae]